MGMRKKNDVTPFEASCPVPIIPLHISHFTCSGMFSAAALVVVTVWRLVGSPELRDNNFDDTDIKGYLKAYKSHRDYSVFSLLVCLSALFLSLLPNSCVRELCWKKYSLREFLSLVTDTELNNSAFVFDDDVDLMSMNYDNFVSAYCLFDCLRLVFVV